MYSHPPINIHSSPLGVSCPANEIAVHKRKGEILDPISERSISTSSLDEGESTPSTKSEKGN